MEPGQVICCTPANVPVVVLCNYVVFCNWGFTMHIAQSYMQNYEDLITTVHIAVSCSTAIAESVNPVDSEFRTGVR